MADVFHYLVGPLLVAVLTVLFQRWMIRREGKQTRALVQKDIATTAAVVEKVGAVHNEVGSVHAIVNDQRDKMLQRIVHLEEQLAESKAATAAITPKRKH